VIRRVFDEGRNVGLIRPWTAPDDQDRRVAGWARRVALDAPDQRDRNGQPFGQVLMNAGRLAQPHESAHQIHDTSTARGLDMVRLRTGGA